MEQSHSTASLPCLDSRVSPLGLAAFRIVYGLVLWAEVAQLFSFRRLVFDEIPYLSRPDLGVDFCLGLWLVAVSAIVVGYHTRLACVLNYAFSVFLFGSFTTYEYHADHVYTVVNLLLIFTPVARRLSVERWMAARRSAQIEGQETVSIWHYHTLILAGAGLVYFDSFFWKIVDPMWREGLGVWLPMSLPHDTWLPANWLSRLLNRHWLMLAASYMTLALEFAFIFMMWSRRLKLPLLAIGLGFHVGILIAFPIPLFALVMISLYVLLVPPEWWERWSSALQARLVARRSLAQQSPSCAAIVPRRRAASTKFRIDWAEAEPPVSPAYQRRTAMPLVVSATISRQATRAVDISAEPTLPSYEQDVNRQQTSNGYDFSSTQDNHSSAPTLTASSGVSSSDDSRPTADYSLRVKLALVGLAALWQIVLIFHSPTFRDPAKPSGSTAFASIRQFAYRYCGVCSHGVFLDGMHRPYDRELALVQVLPQGGLKWLHYVSETGQARRYDSGRVWCAWTHRLAAKNIDAKSFESGVRNFTAFWAAGRGVNLADAQFLVFSRQYEPLKGWQRNYLVRQTQQPWTPIYEARWKDRQFALVPWPTPIEVAQR